MIVWLRERSLLVRMLVYAAAALFAFAVAAGVGAAITLGIQGNLSLPVMEEPSPVGEQNDAPQPQGTNANEPQREEAGAEPGEAASVPDEAEYVAEVGDLQSRAVETFLDSHDKLLRYDALTAIDVEEMRANEAALEEITDQTDALVPPRKHEEQYELFRSALEELHNGAQLAYALAADPTAATLSTFNEYDGHVDEATALLQRSNEMLERNYKTIEGAREISPALGATETVGASEGA